MENIMSIYKNKIKFYFSKYWWIIIMSIFVCLGAYFLATYIRVNGNDDSQETNEENIVYVTRQEWYLEIETDAELYDYNGFVKNKINNITGWANSVEFDQWLKEHKSEPAFEIGGPDEAVFVSSTDGSSFVQVTVRAETKERSKELLENILDFVNEKNETGSFVNIGNDKIEKYERITIGEYVLIPDEEEGTSISDNILEPETITFKEAFSIKTVSFAVLTAILFGFFVILYIAYSQNVVCNENETEHQTKIEYFGSFTECDDIIAKLISLEDVKSVVMVSDGELYDVYLNKITDKLNNSITLNMVQEKDLSEWIISGEDLKNTVLVVEDKKTRIADIQLLVKKIEKYNGSVKGYVYAR